VQVEQLGQVPKVQLPPRDSRAKEVEGLNDSGQVSSSSSTQPPGNSGKQQQPADQPGATDHQSTEAAPSAAAATHAQQQQQQQGPDAGPSSTTAALQGVHDALQEELQQLRSSYLLLQEEYWKQKERLMSMDFDAAQLKAAADRADALAQQVSGSQLADKLRQPLDDIQKDDAWGSILVVCQVSPGRLNSANFLNLEGSCCCRAEAASTPAVETRVDSAVTVVNIHVLHCLHTCRLLLTCKLPSSKRPWKLQAGPGWRQTWLAAGHGYGSLRKQSSST
jgi:hypothetical protein